MKNKAILLSFITAAGILYAEEYTFNSKSPFAPAAGQEGSTAIHMSSENIVGWADGYTNLTYGSYVSDTWKTPAKALGEAAGDSYDIVCLGRGGEITITFSLAVTNGPGFDFAVFENSFSDTFLELAWVEVSSDGDHFVRFPNYSDTPSAVSAFGSVQASYLFGLAGKYRQGYGTPFDLSELEQAYAAILENNTDFSSDSISNFTNNYSYLDLNNIRYIRIIDIVGDGNAQAVDGYPIYDPYPTSGSAGFDLDAVAVLNQQSIAGETQTITFPEIPNQKLSTGSVTLSASSDSGLPVSYTILDGPAFVTDSILTFTNTGTIQVQADQAGNETYAPAAPVLRSFQIAEKLQHIWIEPIPNQIAGSGTWQIQAEASSGLPIYVEVTDGPADVTVDTNTLVLTLGENTGTVTLRTVQTGNKTFAPAEDVTIEFDIVESGATNAPQTFAEWSSDLGLTADAQLDPDNDGAKNLQEYIMGTDPLNSSDISQLIAISAENRYGESAFKLTYTVSLQSYGRARIQTISNLMETDWTNALPEIISTEKIIQNETECARISVQMPTEDPAGFVRLLLQE